MHSRAVVDDASHDIIDSSKQEVVQQEDALIADLADDGVDGAEMFAIKTGEDNAVMVAITRQARSNLSSQQS